jgi:hypothetical protein
MSAAGGPEGGKRSREEGEGEKRDRSNVSLLARSTAGIDHDALHVTSDKSLQEAVTLALRRTT